MTIAISLKVHDGVVLAADSASTLLAQTPAGVGVVNVYNNANKIFNLCKGLPVGALTWGAGNIGASSTSTLAKDFRRRLSGEGEHAWKLDLDNYSVLSIAERLCDFMFTENYLDAFAEWPHKPAMGFMVCGYSSGSALAEEWQINIENGQCSGPFQMRALEDAGVTWNGDPEAITRLLFGMSTVTPQVLTQLGLQDRLDEIIAALRDAQIAPLVQAAMPIEDAADLAEFLVKTTARFNRYMPGADTVGGPIEVAAITKHEGFKWLHRKHYYSSTLNPEVRP